MKKIIALASAGLTALLLTTGGSAFAAKASIPKLTKKEFASAQNIYFDRCSGCHGALRKGATGPKITQKKMLKKSLAKLEEIIYDGTKKGMPGWGKTGDMTRSETKLMAKYMRVKAPVPPEMGLKEMKKSHKVFVSPSQRPSVAQHSRDIQNYFGVILRDVGKGAIIDGDSKKVLTKIRIGHATHIFRASATGRYFYTIGRDGKAAMIDLFYDTPKLVAEVRVCLDARSIEVSKYNGQEGNFEDQLALVGCYWPPQMVILDGQTS